MTRTASATSRRSSIAARCSDQFYDRTRRLATDLQKRVTRSCRRRQARTAIPRSTDRRAERPHDLSREARKRHEGGLCSPRHRASGQGLHRASDPGGHAERPNDAKALVIVNDALSKAEASVHLVGDKPGFAPGGARSTIVKLQLALARAKAAQSGRSIRADALSPHRLGAENRRSGRDGSAGPGDRTRPLQALERCDKQIATDKIDGDILSKFIEYLFQYLTETAPKPVARPRQATSSTSISPITADEDYAGAVAQALCAKAR